MLRKYSLKLYCGPVNWIRSKTRDFFINAHGEKSQANRLIMLGWLGLFGFPLYYWIWEYLFPQPYENIGLRLAGMLVMAPFFFARRLHRAKWFDLYFFCAITYVCPFFFTFMFLMNGGSSVWSQSLLIALIALFHFDGRFALFSFVAGTVIAYFTYVLTQGHFDWPHQDMLSSIPIVAFAVLIVSIVKIGRSILLEEKLLGMASALGVVSHELRTPLRSVDASARGLKRYLPALVAFYEKHHQEFNSDALPTGRLVMMAAALNRIQAEVRYMNSAIDLLLANAGETVKGGQAAEVFRINDVITEALRRYPFEDEQQSTLITVEFNANYAVSGNPDLCMMVLFNLLKNALRALAKAGKGAIRIVTTNVAGENQLIFRDTGCGIPANALPNVFRRFYTYPPNAGTGIGLAFCRDTLEAWGAKINCRSEQNVFTEFVIQFPVVEPEPGTQVK